MGFVTYISMNGQHGYTTSPVTEECMTGTCTFAADPITCRTTVVSGSDPHCDLHANVMGCLSSPVNNYANAQSLIDSIDLGALEWGQHAAYYPNLDLDGYPTNSPQYHLHEAATEYEIPAWLLGVMDGGYQTKNLDFTTNGLPSAGLAPQTGAICDITLCATNMGYQCLYTNAISLNSPAWYIITRFVIEITGASVNVIDCTFHDCADYVGKLACASNSVMISQPCGTPGPGFYWPWNERDAGGGPYTYDPAGGALTLTFSVGPTLQDWSSGIDMYGSLSVSFTSNECS